MEAVRRVQCNWVAMALLSRQVVDKVSQGGELRIVHFRNFNVKLFLKLQDFLSPLGSALMITVRSR